MKMVVRIRIKIRIRSKGGGLFRPDTHYKLLVGLQETFFPAQGDDSNQEEGRPDESEKQRSQKRTQKQSCQGDHRKPTGRTFAGVRGLTIGRAL